MSTPTIGSLRRRLECLEQERRQDVGQDIADLEARVEELEIRLGLLDEDEGERWPHVEELLEDTDIDIDTLIERFKEEQEQEFRRRSTGGPR